MTTIKSTRTPLWSRLAQTLAGDILSGRLPVGSLLPTEAQLMNDYGMSRHTVRPHSWSSSIWGSSGALRAAARS